MLLREHPLFSYHGTPSWPPFWTWRAGGRDQHPRGEVSILIKVEKSSAADKCFLYIDYEGSTYIGCLFCSDHVFCSQIYFETVAARLEALELRKNPSIQIRADVMP